MKTCSTQRRPRRADIQSGFTLVELVSVIVVLGILGATAMPRLTSLSGDARYASLQAARAALLTTSAATHGKFLVNGQSTQVMEDVSVPMVNGYPDAVQATLEAAGLANDYTAYTRVSGPTATTPNTTGGSMSIVPNNIAGTSKSIHCYLVYTKSLAPNTPPIVAVGGNTTAANCA